MRRLLLGTSALVALMAATPGGSAGAQSLTSQGAPPSAAEMALQARIDALEAQNRTVMSENRSLRQRLGRPAAATAAARIDTTPAVSSPAPKRLTPTDADAMASSPSSIWTGAYVGGSLGAGGMHANTPGSSIDTDATPSTTSSTLSGASRPNAGAIADLYAGYSRQSGHWVGGAQVEASLGRIFNRVDQTVSQTQVFGGDTITATSMQTGQLNLNFMVSALARVGYLVDPRNQIYGLAGWTFAGFNTTVVPFAAFTPLAQSFAFLSSSFGANGVTVGAGWEHQIADQWTWRTEYRYTRFQNVTLNAFTTNQFPAFNVDQAGRSTATVSPDLHVLRMGLTRYFDAGSPSAAGIFTEAPAAYATSWTGAYAGLSVGLGGENTRATTNFSSSSLQSTTAGPAIFMNSTNSFSVGNRQFGAGGVADVFIGYNRQMNDWVAGVQLEGTLARFNERLSRTLTQNTNGTSIIRGVTSVNLTASSSSQFDTLSPNWMVTAAARLGRLVTPHDLIYGLAGWSFANFSTSLEAAGDRTFNASGPTVGIGWERQLADQWTMRGEYRYTRFLDKTLSTPTSEAAADAGDTFTASSTSQTGISADSHIVRFGVARAFGG